MAAKDQIRPLDNQRLQRLNNPKLKRTINQSNDLRCFLVKTDCVSEEQLEWIDLVKMTPAERNERLLNIIRRRSVEDFNTFVESLVEDEQLAAADLLLDHGGKWHFGKQLVC